MVKKILGLYPESEFVLCAGDDKTDEDMFASLTAIFSPPSRNSRNGSSNASPQFPETAVRKGSFHAETLSAKSIYTVAVTSSTKYTNAQWRIDSPDDVIQLLHEFATIN